MSETVACESTDLPRCVRERFGCLPFDDAVERWNEPDMREQFTAKTGVEIQAVTSGPQEEVMPGDRVQVVERHLNLPMIRW